MDNWNYDLNPLSDRAHFYLNTLKSTRFTGHPVRDLVEIVFECYGFLSEILENYHGSGEDSQDNVVVLLSSLFAYWPPDKLNEVRSLMQQIKPSTLDNNNNSGSGSGSGSGSSFGSSNNNSGNSSKKRRESDANSKPSMTSSFISVSSKVLSGMKKGFSKSRNDTLRGSDLTPDNSPASSPKRTTIKSPTPRQTSTIDKKIKSDSQDEIRIKSSSVPPISTQNSLENSSNESKIRSASNDSSPPPPTPPSTSVTPSPKNILRVEESQSPTSQSSQLQQLQQEKVKEKVTNSIPTTTTTTTTTTSITTTNQNQNQQRDEDDPIIIAEENPEENLPAPVYKEKIAQSINPSPTNANFVSSGGGITTKNQEYFKRMREDEEQAKKSKEEEESKLTPHELKKIEEEKKQQELHDASKTAHLAKLGSNFIVKKDGRVMGEGAGRAGRGRGGRF